MLYLENEYTEEKQIGLTALYREERCKKEHIRNQSYEQSGLWQENNDWLQWGTTYFSVHYEKPIVENGPFGNTWQL